VRDWETTERVLDTGGFESEQRVLVDVPVVEASASGARTLGVTYWRTVDRFTRGTIRASWSGDGGRLKLLGGATLLGFGTAELAFGDEEVRCRHEIRGGLLALRAGGTITLTQRAAGDRYELSVVVEECRGLRRGPAPRGGRGRSISRARARSMRRSAAATSTFSCGAGRPRRPIVRRRRRGANVTPP